MSEREPYQGQGRADALIVITLQDDGDRVDVKALTQPPFPMKNGDLDWENATGAQRIAMAMLAAAGKAGADVSSA